MSDNWKGLADWLIKAHEDLSEIDERELAKLAKTPPTDEEGRLEAARDAAWREGQLEAYREVAKELRAYADQEQGERQSAHAAATKTHEAEDLAIGEAVESLQRFEEGLKRWEQRERERRAAAPSESKRSTPERSDGAAP
jgi:hypothetical protein